MMKKTFTAACLFFLVCLVLFSDAHAMDPVTIAILAPIAVKVAEVATPYVIRGLQCGGLHMVKMGTRLMDLFRLPLGLLQATVGIPFNLFSDGVRNSITGAVAPVNLLVDTLLLPLAFCGLTANPG